MRILLFKSVSPRDDPKGTDDDKMPIEDKLRLILRQRVQAAETDEERERAKRVLDRFEGGYLGR